MIDELSSGPMENGKACDNGEMVVVRDLECFGSTSSMSLVRIKGRQYIRKQLRPEYASQPFYRNLFRKEYEAGVKLDCPYIVRYERVVEDNDGIYILAEYVNGCTLEEKIDEDPMYFAKPSNVVRMIDQLLEALGCMHQNHILHLDLKPDNVMFTQVGENIKVIDLGFCFTDAFSYLSGYTPAFAAPEQERRRFASVTKLDESTDIYALGKILAYVESECDVTLPSLYRKIKEKCLKRNKGRRFRNVGEIKKVIRNYRLRRKCIKVYATAFAALLVALGVWCLVKPEKLEYIVYEYHRYYVADSNALECEIVGGSLNSSVIIDPNISYEGVSYSVTGIADSAYMDSVWVKSVFIPEGVRRIGSSAFEQCLYITTINVPGTVTHIGEAAFRRCVSLKSVYLPPSIEKISKLTFGTCMNLQTIVVPEGVTEIGMDAFIECYKLHDIELPSTLKKISRGAFWECRELEEIHIPASVISIGEYAFFHCEKLKDIYVHAKTPPAISRITNNDDITIHVPAESLDAYLRDLEWRKCKIVGDIE